MLLKDIYLEKKIKMKTINEKIKELRVEKGFSQKFVAEYLKIDRSNYSKYELGKLELSLEMLKQLCLLYNVSADYLLGLKEI